MELLNILDPEASCLSLQRVLPSVLITMEVLRSVCDAHENRCFKEEKTSTQSNQKQYVKNESVQQTSIDPTT